MAEQQVDILQLDPEDQLSLFSRTSLLKTVIISVLIHIVIIGASFASKQLQPPAEDPLANVPTTPVEEEAPAEEGKPAEEKKQPEEKDPKEGEVMDPAEVKNPAMKKKFEGVEDPKEDPMDPEFKLD